VVNFQNALQLFKAKIHHLRKKELIQVFSWTSLSTIIGILAKLVKGKVLAVVVGPAGIAYMGQLTNFMALFSHISSGGMSAGLTKYIAEHKDSESEYMKYFSNGMLITLVFSTIASIILIIFHKTFTQQIFLSTEYSSIIVIFSVTIFAVAFNRYLLAITNGFKEYRKYIGGDIIRNLSILVFSVTLVLIYKVYGALLAMVLSQSIVLIITILMIRKLPWFKLRNFKPAFDKAVSKKLLSYSLVSAATFYLGPTAVLMIRSFIMRQLGVDAAGLWDGATRISGYGLMIITQALTVYLIPRFSELIEKAQIRKEIINTYKIVLPLLILGYSFVYLSRDFFIRLLLSESFLPMGNLLFFQFLGDTIKIIGWIISIQLIAKAMLRTLLITEIVFNVLIVLLSYMGILLFGLKGVVIAHTVNYSIYLFVIVMIFKNTLFTNKKHVA
jgi:O-antigen/teichoic acid export membrane protein